MKTKNKNPFYFLLILVGILFFVTATAYGVMAIRETNRPDGTIGQVATEQPSVPEGGLLEFMDQQHLVHRHDEQHWEPDTPT